MRRVGPVVAAVALSMTGLAACSSGDDAYCSKLEEASADFEFEANAGDLGAMQEQLDKVRGHVKDIHSAAPEDIEKHWATMEKSLDSLAPALKEFEGIDDIQSLSPEEQAELMQKVDMEQLQTDSTDIMEAGQAIQKDGKERCGIETQ